MTTKIELLQYNQGWTDETLLRLLLDALDSDTAAEEAVCTYLQQVADLENEDHNA